MADDSSTPQIFLSWSGEVSKQIAIALQRWFAVVFESLHAWVSDTDIALGARSIKSIEENLDKSIGGLLILTVENQSSAWVNFEAGALSREFNGREGRVIPLLVDATQMNQLKSPLNTFQGQLLSRDGMQRVLEALFDMIGRDKSLAATRMAAYWPQLENEIERIRAEHSGPAPVAKPVALADLQEQLMRIERILSDRNETLKVDPLDYLTWRRNLKGSWLSGSPESTEFSRLLLEAIGARGGEAFLRLKAAEVEIENRFKQCGIPVTRVAQDGTHSYCRVTLEADVASPEAIKLAQDLEDELNVRVLLSGAEKPPL